MAKTFDLFLNISPNLASNIPKPKNPFNSYLKNRAIYLFLKPVKETEFVKFIGTLSSNRSIGSYTIIIQALKKICRFFQTTTDLIFLLNRVFSQTL